MLVSSQCYQVLAYGHTMLTPLHNSDSWRHTIRVMHVIRLHILRNKRRKRGSLWTWTIIDRVLLIGHISLRLDPPWARLCNDFSKIIRSLKRYSNRVLHRYLNIPTIFLFKIAQVVEQWLRFPEVKDGVGCYLRSCTLPISFPCQYHVLHQRHNIPINLCECRSTGLNKSRNISTKFADIWYDMHGNVFQIHEGGVLHRETDGSCILVTFAHFLCHRCVLNWSRKISAKFSDDWSNNKE